MKVKKSKPTIKVRLSARFINYVPRTKLGLITKVRRLRQLARSMPEDSLERIQLEDAIKVYRHAAKWTPKYDKIDREDIRNELESSRLHRDYLIENHFTGVLQKPEEVPGYAGSDAAYLDGQWVDMIGPDAEKRRSEAEGRSIILKSVPVYPTDALFYELSKIGLKFPYDEHFLMQAMDTSRDFSYKPIYVDMRAGIDSAGRVTHTHIAGVYLDEQSIRKKQPLSLKMVRKIPSMRFFPKDLARPSTIPRDLEGKKLYQFSAGRLDAQLLIPHKELARAVKNGKRERNKYSSGETGRQKGLK